MSRLLPDICYDAYHIVFFRCSSAEGQIQNGTGVGALAALSYILHASYPYLSDISAACGAFIGVVGVYRIVKQWWIDRKARKANRI